jgi:uncharacterized protein YjiS (DUF1127 family)
MAATEIERLVRRTVGRFSILLQNWRERDSDLRHLQRLSGHMLRDIGAMHHDVDYRAE